MTTHINMGYEQEKQILSYIEKHIPCEQKVVIGVSGGPDSMLLAYYMNLYYHKNKWDRSNISIAHYNHGQREESQKEYLFLKEYFVHNYFYWNQEIPKPNQKETALRTLRHDFFKEVLQDSNSSILLLGHNFTDRIETSLLNIVRGSGKTGRLGIKPKEQNQIQKKEYTIYRPLIDISKNDIQQLCDKNHVPYFIDHTNNIENTPRNILRNTIIPSLQGLHTGGKKTWESSWKHLYTVLGKNKYGSSIKENFPHHTWGVTTWVSCHKKYITPEVLYMIFHKDTYITTSAIKSIMTFVTSGTQGHYYVGGWYIFLSNNTVHFLFGPKEFWKNPSKLKKQITHTGLLQFDSNIYNIEKEWIGCTIRYPQSGDIYKKKKLTKVLTNKKIPVFMRNTIPVIAKDNIIVAILD